MLKILAVLGWILLGIVALLLWVIIVPRTVFMEYSARDSLAVKVRVFLFKIKVYPLNLPFRKKEKKKEKPKARKKKGKKSTGKKTAKKQQPAATKDKKGFDIMEKLPKGMELVKTVLSAVKGVFRILLKGIAIKDVSFNLPVTGGDAYAVQQKYGKITSAFYTFSIFLQKYVKITYKSPVFIADFANLYGQSTYFYCKIQASPGIILAVGWHLFKIYRDLDKQPKEN